MLRVKIPATELFDKVKQEFIDIPSMTLDLEHSLVAISKWESKWMKPFMGHEEKTDDQIYDYIQCMIVNDIEVSDMAIRNLPRSVLDQVTSYIKSPMTATTIKQSNSKSSREIITSELIYYWMIALEIPFECQHWHLNRLLTLINVCNVKNEKPKKQNPKDILARNKALNAARKKKLNTSG